MFASLWHDFLYQPLFNILIWIYNHWTDMNFGWAVVYLTVMLRVILLPFTLVTERDKARNAELAEDIRRTEKQFHSDPVLKKEEIRKVLKKRKVHPWAKVVVIGVQLLVLILLYQVFLRGITGEKILKILYPWIDFPGKINLEFFGFDLGKRYDILWPGMVALFLLGEIYVDYRRRKFRLTKADLAYFLLFPFFSFIALWLLPMVKSLFILTSLVFSVIIHWISMGVFRGKKSPP